MTKRRILIGVALMALLVIVGGALLPPLHWDGAIVLPVQVTVTEIESQKPIADASVTMVLPNTEMSPVKTDNAGITEFAVAFPAGGTSRLGFRSGIIHLGDHQLRISAKDYEAQQFYLMEKTGKNRDIDNRDPISITIQLKPSASVTPTQ